MQSTQYPFFIDFCIFVIQNKIVMTTITLKINEKSKAGKTLLSMVRFFTEEKNGVELLKTPNLETVKAMSKAEKNNEITNPEIIKRLKKHHKNFKKPIYRKENYTKVDAKNIWEATQ